MPTVRNEPWSEVVDVVVPVYRGMADTRRCLESVLAAPNRTPFRVTVIDDASPDPDLAAWLAALATCDHRVELLRNAQNQGFVRSANAGMSRHPDRDVVLLNSDTEVNGDWLDRLRACAWSVSAVGTVTPLSNNATLASYPVFMAENDLPEGYDAAAMDALCREVNTGLSAPVPTGVGFCLYIRRDCLADVGYFDARRFGRGYGEENDFCRRADAVGWAHRLAGDVFVWHQGGVSFGTTAEHWRQLGGGEMRRAHPDYERVVAAHVEADPQRPLRRRLDLARLCASPRPRVLNLTHSQGGGVARHLADMARLLSDDLELLALAPVSRDTVELRWLRPGEAAFSLVFRLPFEHEALVALLRAVDIGRVHVHHTMNLPSRLLELPAELGVPMDFTAHDHYPMCPQANLTDEHGEYCGEPDEAGCARCLAVRPAPWGLDIRTWRESAGRLLAAADRVFVPTADTLARYRAYFPSANYVLAPHPEPVLPAAVAASPVAGETETVRVLVLGVLNPAKGLRLVERCAWDARKRGLPMEFRVIGSFENPVAGIDQLPLSATGPYDAAELSAHITAERGHVILFPSRAPETWSYTLSEGLATGLPIVATARGALRERLVACARATLMPPEAPASEWNDRLVAVGRNSGGVSGAPRCDGLPI